MCVGRALASSFDRYCSNLGACDSCVRPVPAHFWMSHCTVGTHACHSRLCWSRPPWKDFLDIFAEPFSPFSIFLKAFEGYYPTEIHFCESLSNSELLLSRCKRALSLEPVSEWVCKTLLTRSLSQSRWPHSIAAGPNPPLTLLLILIIVRAHPPCQIGPHPAHHSKMNLLGFATEQPEHVTPLPIFQIDLTLLLN